MGSSISLIDRGASAASQGWRALLDALASRDIDAELIACPRPDDVLAVVAGPVSDERVAALLRSGGVVYSDRPEGIVSCRCEWSPEREVVVLAGTDPRGMMYSLFDAADAVLDAGVAGLLETGCRVEYPQTAVRGLDRFIMGPLDDEWFLSEDFWRYYLHRLARCRFNRFVLVTGFDTAYFSPPYPFLVEVPGYESVHVTGLSRHRRDQNLGQLNEIGRMCHEHGLEFIFGT